MPRWVWYIILVVFIIWAASAPVQAGNDVHLWFQDIVSFFQHLARG